MKPENVSLFIERRKAEEAAVEAAENAKVARKAVARLDRNLVEANTALTPGERFVAASQTIFEQRAEQLSLVISHQRCDQTPEKLVTCNVDGEEIEFKVSFRLFTVKDVPVEITSSWSPVAVEDSENIELYSVYETALTGVKDLTDQVPLETADSLLTGLANVESSLAAFLESDRYTTTPASD